MLAVGLTEIVACRAIFQSKLIALRHTSFTGAVMLAGLLLTQGKWQLKRLSSRFIRNKSERLRRWAYTARRLKQELPIWSRLEREEREVAARSPAAEANLERDPKSWSVAWVSALNARAIDGSYNKIAHAAHD